MPFTNQQVAHLRLTVLYVNYISVYNCTVKLGKKKKCFSALEHFEFISLVISIPDYFLKTSDRYISGKYGAGVP